MHVLLSNNTPIILLTLTIWIAFAMTTPSHANAQPKPTDSVQHWTHPSGVEVFLVEKHSFPYITATILLKTGSVYDPPGKEGLAEVTADLMLRGAGTRDRDTLDRDLEELGVELDTDTAKNSITFDTDTLSRNLDTIAPILADVLIKPTLSPDELQRLLREKQSDLLQVQDNDSALARRFFSQRLFQNHPYGRLTPGTHSSLSSITIDDVRTFHSTHVRASNLLFGFSGDITRTQINSLLDTHFQSLPSGKPKPLTLPQPTPLPKGRHILLVDKPDRTQTQIVLGHLAPKVSNPDYDALEIVNTWFGGTFTARLNHEIRDQRGLSYGAYSSFSTDAHTGSFSMRTYPATEDARKTIDLLLSLYEDLINTPLTQEDIDFARNYLINSFASRIDTPEKLLNEAIYLHLQNLPLSYLDTTAQRLNAVTPEIANAAIQKHLHPDTLILTMLCTAKPFQTSLQSIPNLSSLHTYPHTSTFTPKTQTP